MKNVAAIVVTFNRKQLLLECLSSLTKQSKSLEQIYVIDNASSDGTTDILIKEGYISSEWEYEKFKIIGSTKISYIKLEENLGGAGGFSKGIEVALKDGNFDWLWIMDDDAIPENNALEELLNYNSSKNTVALAGKVLNPDGSTAIMHRGIFDYNDMFPNLQKPLSSEHYGMESYKIDFASFVGILVRTDVVRKIGLPVSSFFIHNDDLEYCIRLRTEGEIVLLPKSVIRHKELSKPLVEKSFLNLTSNRKPIETFWISYYAPRNLLFIAKNYSPSQFKAFIQALKRYLKEVVGILMFDDYKFKRIKLITKAYFDGLFGRSGKRVTPDYFKKVSIK